MKVEKEAAEGKVISIRIRRKKKSRGIDVSALRSLRGCFGREVSDDQIIVLTPGSRLILLSPTLIKDANEERPRGGVIWNRNKIRLSELLQYSGFLKFGKTLKLRRIDPDDPTEGMENPTDEEDILELL